MSRRVVPLGTAYADALPPACSWTTDVAAEWGTCGQVLLVDGQPRGWAVYAPAGLVPGAERSPTAPTTPDSVLLAGAWVDEPLRGGGLGRVLVQGVARDLSLRRACALEAFGDTRGRARSQAGVVVLPADFLTAVGFVVTRPHSTTPRLRMDLRAAVSWKEGVEQALVRLAGIVRPAPEPAPERTARAVRLRVVRVRVAEPAGPIRPAGPPAP